MSRLQQPKPAKLIIGLIMREKRLLAPAAQDLVHKYGPLDIVSSWMAFDYTTYYKKEMGSPLFRRVLAFKNLIGQDQLVEVKIFTQRLEQEYACGKHRQINVDPGYLVHERLVLASGKNFSHRIYLGSGVFADLTLIYQKGSYRSLPWTYPDYADQPLLDFLQQVRNKYHTDFQEKY
jgi:hypothetical protein